MHAVARSLASEEASAAPPVLAPAPPAAAQGPDLTPGSTAGPAGVDAAATCTSGADAPARPGASPAEQAGSSGTGDAAASTSSSTLRDGSSSAAGGGAAGSTGPADNQGASDGTSTTSSSSSSAGNGTGRIGDNGGRGGDGGGGDSSSSSSSGAPTGPASGAARAGARGPPPAPAAPFLMHSGASMLPHPDKAHRGGEDAFFISDPPLAVGVADGVGGWAEIGVDAGAYARLLMSHAKEEAEALLSGGGPLSPQAVLERAYYRTNVQGSSTVCILSLNGATLCASNLGDSGFILVRDGLPAFQSPQQQHNFNFPYQIGSADGGASDHPASAMRFELGVQPGDVVVCGTDGLWDNVFAEEAATIVARCKAQGDGPEAAANTLCRYARMRATDPKYQSPFSYSALQAGYMYVGGKLDDITVLVSYVTMAGAKL